MKLFNLLSLLLLWFYFTSCSENKPPSEKSETAVVSTPGVLCGSCAKTIEKAVLKLEGVQEVNVDVEKKVVEVKFLSGKIDMYSIETSITEVGYDANDTKRSVEAYEKLDLCCKIDG